MSWEVPIMRSKNWSFKLSRPLIRKDFTRFWPVWGSYLAIWLLMLPIPLITFTMGTGYTQAELARDIQDFLVDISTTGSLVMSAIYGGLAAFAVWSYLYQSRSASLFHALPVTRETLFASHFTAGLGFLVVPNVLIAPIIMLLAGDGVVIAHGDIFSEGFVLLQKIFHHLVPGLACKALIVALCGKGRRNSRAQQTQQKQ